MKLIRLKITDPKGFRSLQCGFEVTFMREKDYPEKEVFNPYILAGPNGSGKSNILEVLAAIFYHIECIYLNNKPQIFEYEENDNPQGFRSDVSSPNSFEVEYAILAPPKLYLSKSQIKEYVHIKIIKENKEEPKVYWVNSEAFNYTANKLLAGIEIREVLPDFVLGYSSGENEILSLPFFKMRFIHFDEYKDSLIQQTTYSTSEGRLTFLDSEFNQAILLSNLLLQEKIVLSPFAEEVGIQEIMKFRIIIKKYIELDKSQITNDLEDTTRYSENIVNTYEDELEKQHFKLDITQNLKTIIQKSGQFETHTIIQKFERCSTCKYYDDEDDILYLDFWVNDETRKAFEADFYSARELFQAFQILMTLNLYTVSEDLKKEIYKSTSLYVNEAVPTLPSDERIMRFEDVWLKKNGVAGEILYKSLSDGEHQFLHSLGLCLLYSDKKCLFLLDEPETHFNPDWRAKFISSLRNCFEQGDAKDTMREMLITTHAPFLISDSKREHVLVFNKNTETNTVSVTRPDYNTLGASINKITMKTFGKTETIGGYAEKQLGAFIRRFEAGESKQKLIDEVNATLGDSVEKVLFVNRVLQSMERK
jgi:restriction system-associated AAA family ATPase